MIPDNIRKIATTIGQYYLEKNYSDYDKTELALLRLGISSITEQEDGKIAITTARPGMLIGKRGETVDELIKRLGKPIHIIEDKDPLINHLMPHEDMDWEEGYWQTPPEWEGLE